MAISTSSHPIIDTDSEATKRQASVTILRHATVVVGGTAVWSDVSLDIGTGEFVAILGPNGAGKSTLLHVILGLTPVTSGQVTVLGAPAGRHRQSQIGYLPQRRAFDTALRLRGIDIVRLGLDGNRWGIPLPWLSRLAAPERARSRDQRLREVIEMVGASRYAHRPIGVCSGGEQQRLLIAQALIRRPRLLLLDEPLDSLDVPSQAAISTLLHDICRDQGVTVIMVAHDVNPLANYLDRLIYVAGGRVLHGTPEEVITGEKLTALYGTPIEVLHDSAGRLVVVGQPDAATTAHGPTR